MFFGAELKERVVQELGEADARQAYALAEALGRMSLENHATVVVPVRASDARAAGGAGLIRRTIEAVASPDDPDIHAKAKEAIAALKAIAPRTPVEGGLASLFLVMERAALDCMGVARIAGFGTPLGATMVVRAEKLACRAIEAADALSRQRFRGQQTVRVEHVHVHEGGQAVIGAVGGGETR
jgi:hypothetical protein